MPSPPANPKCEYYGCVPSTTPGHVQLKSPHFSLLDPTAEQTIPVVYEVGELPPPPLDCLRIVLISDTHEQHRGLALPLGDLLLHCGDVQMGFWPFHRPRKQLRDFFKWFRGQPHPVKIFISGNHDYMLRDMTPEAVRRAVAPALYLRDESCVVEPVGLRLYGTPRSVANSKLSPNTAFQSRHAWAPFPSPPPAAAAAAAPAAAEKAAEGITQLRRGAPLTVRLEGPTPAGPVDILLTHQSVERAAVCPLAQQPITAYVQQVAPRLHVSGHLHLSHGWQPVPLPARTATAEEREAVQPNEDTTIITSMTTTNNNADDSHQDKVIHREEVGGEATTAAADTEKPFVPSINASLLILKGFKPTLLLPCVVDIQI